MRSKVRMICEAALLLAMAQVLSYIRLYKMPGGGSVDLAMLPIFILGARLGWKWGLGSGIVYGLMQYFIGGGTAIDWTTMVADYLVAYTLLGLGCGFGYRFRKHGLIVGASCGCLLRFLAHFVVGAVVWGRYMPESFLGLPMVNEWVYSLLYNGTYMALDYILCTILVLVLGKIVPQIVHPGILDEKKA